MVVSNLVNVVDVIKQQVHALNVLLAFGVMTAITLATTHVAIRDAINSTVTVLIVYQDYTVLIVI